jgi:hypothetical protein
VAGAYYERTGDLASVESLWPHVEAALGWVDRYGDRDGDGFVEYERQSCDGLLHQGWKDTDDAVFHEGGSLGRGPIALYEVQGYVSAARRAGAVLAAALGLPGRAVELGAGRGAAAAVRAGVLVRGAVHLPWPWTGRSSPAGCRHQTPASVCLQALPAPTGPGEWSGLC